MATHDTVLMRGFSVLRARIAEYLAMAVPPLITTARAQWGLEDWQLPMPAKYDLTDPFSVAEYPTIGSYSLRDGEHTRTDITNAGELEFWARFTTIIFVYVRSPMDDLGQWEAPEHESCLRLRDDMTRIVHAALLLKHSLGYPDSVKFDENTMSTDYLPPQPPNTQSKRWVSGSLITVDYKMRETTWQPIIGNANTVFPIEFGSIPES